MARYRIGGEICLALREVAETQVVTTQVFDELLQYREERCAIDKSVFVSLDFSFLYEGRSFRAHVYQSKGIPTCALRVLPSAGLAVESDADFPLWEMLCHLQEGLVLVSGPTGSGKTYTLGSCMEYMSRQRASHIITLEDPIEIPFSHQKGIVHQRELGKDMTSMASGLRDALREDPDIIMVGEMRDLETIEAALHAAETGHVVWATVHTTTARQAIGRIISAFPGERQEEVRTMLAQVLRAVVCQRLLRKDTLFLPVRDIVINNRAVANLIRQGKEHQILAVQETAPLMRTFSKSVIQMRQEYGSWVGLEILAKSLEV